ncbi:MAG: hypothetical protein H0U49_02355 [Parachlamydiaceae bacterium]|nr:hypothetical protein [Parachlamydiaceae bacterium]
MYPNSALKRNNQPTAYPIEIKNEKSDKAHSETHEMSPKSHILNTQIVAKDEKTLKLKKFTSYSSSSGSSISQLVPQDETMFKKFTSYSTSSGGSIDSLQFEDQDLIAEGLGNLTQSSSSNHKHRLKVDLSKVITSFSSSHGRTSPIGRSPGKSPKDSGSNRFPLCEKNLYSVSTFDLPKGLISKYDNYLETLIKEKNHVSLLKLDMESDSREFNINMYQSLKTKLTKENRSSNSVSQSNLVHVNAFEFCREAYATALSEGYTKKQIEESGMDFNAAILQFMQSKGILLRDIYPLIIQLEKDLFDYLITNNAITKNAASFCTYLDEISSLNCTSELKGSNTAHKEISVFLDELNKYSNDYHNIKSGLVSARLRSKSISNDTYHPFYELTVAAIGRGNFEEGLNVLKALNFYKNPTGVGSQYVLYYLNAKCSSVPQLCYFESNIHTYAYKCTVKHYYERKLSEGNKRLQAHENSHINIFTTTVTAPISTANDITPSTSPTSKSPRKLSFTLLKLSPRSKSSHSSEEKSSQENANEISNSLDLATSAYKVHKISPKFLLRSNTKPFFYDLRGIRLGLQTYSENPIKDVAMVFVDSAHEIMSLKASLPMICINGEVFMKKSTTSPSLISQLDPRLKIFNQMPTEAINIKTYSSVEELLRNLIKKLYEHGFNKPKQINSDQTLTTSSTKILETLKPKMTFDIFLEINKKVESDTDKIIFYSKNPESLTALSEQRNPPEQTQMIPTLRVLELIAEPCSLRAIEYMSLLFPDFFPDQNPFAHYFFELNNDHIENYIGITDSETFKVTQLNLLEIRSVLNKDVVATIIYSWENYPLEKEATFVYNPHRGWEATFRILKCNVFKVEHFLPIMKNLNDPNPINDYHDFIGTQFESVQDSIFTLDEKTTDTITI